MKKIFVLATAAFLITGASFANGGDGKKCTKGCCKKDAKTEKAAVKKEAKADKAAAKTTAKLTAKS